jgi:hypothetical protein
VVVDKVVYSNRFFFLVGRDRPSRSIIFIGILCSGFVEAAKSLVVLLSSWLFRRRKMETTSSRRWNFTTRTDDDEEEEVDFWMYHGTSPPLW